MVNSETTNSNIVTRWFGKDFESLHPLLQQLHLNGGELKGDIKLEFGSGVAGWIGRRLARKLGLPKYATEMSQAIVELKVDISHDKNGLYWSRLFDESNVMKSVFVPAGNIEKGFWVEDSGALRLILTVDIINGGWHWRCLGFRLFGIPMPMWLFPKSKAYKIIENDKYRFYVGFSFFGIGKLFSYSGLLGISNSKIESI